MYWDGYPREGYFIKSFGPRHLRDLWLQHVTLAPRDTLVASFSQRLWGINTSLNKLWLSRGVKSTRFSAPSPASGDVRAVLHRALPSGCNKTERSSVTRKLCFTVTSLPPRQLGNRRRLPGTDWLPFQSGSTRSKTNWD